MKQDSMSMNLIGIELQEKEEKVIFLMMMMTDEENQAPCFLENSSNQVLFKD